MPPHLLARPASRQSTAVASILLASLFAGCTGGDSRSSVSAPNSTLARIGDLIWEDQNGNGIQDDGEPGLGGLRMSLTNTSGTLSRETVSEADGSYSFTQLPADTYTISYDLVDLPGYTETTCGVGDDPEIDSNCVEDEIEFIAERDLSIDFGFIPPIDGIGDRVWLDYDCNGLQDDGEPGLDGVRVILRDAVGVQLAERTTAAGGRYLFPGLPPGEFQVEVDASTLIPGLVPTACMAGNDPELDNNCSPALVELTPGALLDLSVDFGYGLCDGNSIIGDRVWHDLDRDGLQDVGEPGLEGVLVNLASVGGATTAQAETGPGGSYFFTQLPLGQYLLTVDEASLPPGFFPTPCGDGSDPARDNDCSPVLVDIPTSTTFEPRIDFGFASNCDGSIGDRVWHDLDCDGLREDGEPGIGGVLIELYDEFGNFISQVTTSGGGRYSFGGLCPGTYEVRVDESTLPLGFFPTPCEQGPDPERDSNCNPTLVTLLGEFGDRSIDFGYCSPDIGIIGNFIWNDLDENGLQDPGEQGLPGIDVRLFDDTDTEIRFATTGIEGTYWFTGLAAGTYRVEVDESTLPPSFVASPCDVGADEAIDNDCSPILVTLDSPLEFNPRIDFGYHATGLGLIGDRVWLDEDGDSQQDSQEQGIPEVRVVLLDELGVQLATTFTSADGMFSFNGLTAGAYVVEVDETTLPANLTASACDVGESTCNPAAVPLASGEVRTDVDFGYTEFLEEPFEGCSPAFWLAPENHAAWPAPYTPDTLFSDVFEDALPGSTFGEVLSLTGGGVQSLGRHAVTGFLNAHAAGVEYELTAAEIVLLFDGVYPGTSAEYYSVRLFLTKLNERHCPLE